MMILYWLWHRLCFLGFHIRIVCQPWTRFWLNYYSQVSNWVYEQFFCNRGLSHSLTSTHCLFYIDSFRLSGSFKWWVWPLACLLWWTFQGHTSLLLVNVPNCFKSHKQDHSNQPYWNWLLCKWSMSALYLSLH